MNDDEPSRIEAELRELRPAKLPPDFAARLAAARPGAAHPCRLPSAHEARPVRWTHLLRWFAPATAAVAGILALVIWQKAPGKSSGPTPVDVSTPASLHADDVEIDRRLIGAFEAIATLPGGEPVRIRCREWMDEVVLRDTSRGVAIQQRAPRIEIVPVSFETF